MKVSKEQPIQILVADRSQQMIVADILLQSGYAIKLEERKLINSVGDRKLDFFVLIVGFPEFSEYYV